MKLKTEMQDGCVHTLGYCVDESDVSPLQAAHLQYDAAAAHALKQAIQEFASYGNQDDADSLRKRADEIMREFGYEVE